MNDLKICIISIYFGKLPDWINIWFSSASYNKTIDFLFVTDQDIRYKYNNIKIINMSFDKFRKLATEKLNQKIKLNTPYKLCDYKEVWGKILEDEIIDYDYWGECDTDVVFGDIKFFIEKYQLHKYDKFGCRGHLTLYKNKKNVIDRYKFKGGWFGTYKEVFSSNMIWAFDETPGINAIYEKNCFSAMNEIVFADIDVNYDDIRLVEFNENSPKNYTRQIFYWSNGKILRSYIENDTRKIDEFMYIHLQKRKMSKPNFNPFEYEDFFIINGMFIKKGDSSIEDEIDKYNKRNDLMRTKKKFGGKYKKDLRFYWIGRRILNAKYDFKMIIKKAIKFIKKER